MLFQYGEGDDAQIIAGYVDDTVKEGIRRYWKVRRVTEQRQLIKRIDVRMKIELPVQFMQDTWALNSDGEIDKEQGQTIFLSFMTFTAYTFSLHKPRNPAFLPAPPDLRNGAGCRLHT